MPSGSTSSILRKKGSELSLGFSGWKGVIEQDGVIIDRLPAASAAAAAVAAAFLLRGCCVLSSSSWRRREGEKRPEASWLGHRSGVRTHTHAPQGEK